MSQIYYENKSLLDEKINEIINAKISIIKKKIKKVTNLVDEKEKFQDEKINIEENKQSSVISSKFETNMPNNEFPIFEEKCEICLSLPLTRSKFICLFCDDMIICEECESQHQHACIKVKYYCISDLAILNKIMDLSKIESYKKSIFTMTKELIFGSANN